MNVHVLEADGPPIADGGDVLALIYDEAAAEADWIAVPVERFEPGFFDLRTGIAGDIAQKVVNYRARLAVVGDVSVQTERSTAFRDFVRESARSPHLRFVPDVAALTGG